MVDAGGKYGKSNRWLGFTEEVCASTRDYLNFDLEADLVEAACKELESHMRNMPQPYRDLAERACELARLTVTFREEW